MIKIIGIQKKVLSLAIALSYSSVMSTTAFAAASTEEVMPLAEGLISQRSLSGTYGYKHPDDRCQPHWF